MKHKQIEQEFDLHKELTELVGIANRTIPGQVTHKIERIKSLVEQNSISEQHTEKVEEKPHTVHKTKSMNGDCMVKQIFNVQEDVIMFAFRYALGRRTGAVSYMVDVVMNNWNDLKPFTQEQIQGEIREAIRMKKAGWDCDVEEWQKILSLEPKYEISS